MRLSVALLIGLVAAASCHAAPGFYHVEQRNGIWWFVAPDGKPFFSNGVNVIATGATRESYRPARAEYAALRHYASVDGWADATLARLRSWNFNTIGGWSNDVLQQRGTMPYTVVLDLASATGAPWSDLFSPATARQFDEAARRKVSPLKDDASLLGYFTDNELGWWDDTLLWFFFKQPQSNATRQVLMRLLRQHYQENFAQFERDFDVGEARGFDALDHGAELTLRPGGRGQEVVDQFTYMLAERYYQLAHDAIRRYDPNHLIMGDRYLGWYVAAVVRAARQYVDVISTNYAADWLDGNISRFYLDTLHRLTGKPILITEYYMCAMENRSGNRNTSANFPTVQTQRQRAASFRTNLTALARLPFVIGAHWFQYFDEPTGGRATDGEDYNMGLVDINDQPYAELTATATALRPDVIHQRSANAVSQLRHSLIAAATGKPEDGLRGWDKEHSFVASLGGANLPFADLYACWDQAHLYLAVHAADFAEPQLYARNVIPEAERMTWTIHLGSGRPPLQIRFGTGGKATISGPPVIHQEWQNAARFTLLVKLPASLLGKAQLRAGQSLRLRAALASHGRAESMQWNRSLRLQPASVKAEWNSR
jgi:hypothetical protein